MRRQQIGDAYPAVRLPAAGAGPVDEANLGHANLVERDAREVEGIVGDVLEAHQNAAPGIGRKVDALLQPAVAVTRLLDAVARVAVAIVRAVGVGVRRGAAMHGVPGAATIGRDLDVPVVEILLDCVPDVVLERGMVYVAQVERARERAVHLIAAVAPPL